MKARALIKNTVGQFTIAEDPAKATHLRIVFPVGFLGDTSRPITISVTDKELPRWHWNGSIETPTLTPSLLTSFETKTAKHICHSFVTNGKAQFLGDCTHELANSTVDLLSIDQDDGFY